MHSQSFRRSLRFLTAVGISVCAGAFSAYSLDLNTESRMVVAQASETTESTDAPLMEHGHDASAATQLPPDPSPQMNKKRMAFWGVLFMSATSIAFIIFGAWAMRKAPKPGQKRPE